METCNSLMNSKMCINEILNKEYFARFNNLKQITHGLDFKPIWHRSSRFLVKRRDSEQSHMFSSAEDLHVLAKSYGNCNGESNNKKIEEGAANSATSSMTNLITAACAPGPVTNIQD